jgi:hypothetical protein
MEAGASRNTSGFAATAIVTGGDHEASGDFCATT